METFFNAVLGDVVSRSMSFLFSKCERQQAAAAAAPDAQEEGLRRLHHLLLRSNTIVEEAQRRHVENRAMRLQLKALMDETFRGYYVLDTLICRSSSSASKDGGGGGKQETKEEAGEASRHHALALSRSPSNPAKRLRLFLSSAAAASSGGGGGSGSSPDEPSAKELEQMVRRLEVMIGDMKEFVVFLMGCPPMYRQPYSAHLFVEKCMFGRNMEREMIMEFLLKTEPPPGDDNNLGVLPIVGPIHIGKTTLVEHVCNDERVRSHFSIILFYSGNHLVKDETSSSCSSFRDKCVIKHQNSGADDSAAAAEAAASGRMRPSLIVIEVLEDVDEETWEWLYSTERSTAAKGSRIIITSRSESIGRFGTTEALKLKCLSLEASWYYFKMLTFGSDDPGQHHPKMEALAMEITSVHQGSFMSSWMAAALLRADFNIESWSRILTRTKEYRKKNASLIGEHLDDVRARDHRRYSWSLVKPRPDKYFMLDDIYYINPTDAEAEVPRITLIDLISGCAQPQGKYEILFWKSPIPPYYNYVCTCETIDI